MRSGRVRLGWVGRVGQCNELAGVGQGSVGAVRLVWGRSGGGVAVS